MNGGQARRRKFSSQRGERHEGQAHLSGPPLRAHRPHPDLFRRFAPDAPDRRGGHPARRPGGVPPAPGGGAADRGAHGRRLRRHARGQRRGGGPAGHPPPGETHPGAPRGGIRLLHLQPRPGPGHRPLPGGLGRGGGHRSALPEALRQSGPDPPRCLPAPAQAPAHRRRAHPRPDFTRRRPGPPRPAAHRRPGGRRCQGDPRGLGDHPDRRPAASGAGGTGREPPHRLCHGPDPGPGTGGAGQPPAAHRQLSRRGAGGPDRVRRLPGQRRRRGRGGGRGPRRPDGLSTRHRPHPGRGGRDRGLCPLRPPEPGGCWRGWRWPDRLRPRPNQR